MLETWDGETHAIRAGQHYRLGEGGVAAGFPRPLAQRWPDLPSNIGAGVTWHKTNGNTTYFFSGDQFWKYDKVSNEHHIMKSITFGHNYPLTGRSTGPKLAQANLGLAQLASRYRGGTAVPSQQLPLLL